MTNQFEIKDNTLYIGGCNTVELAKQHGTPLYVMDENYIRSVCRDYQKAMDGVDGKILYASKAFLSVAMCKIVESEGLGLDVVSSAELYTAVKADFPRKLIYMHSNNKTPSDIDFAVRENIGSIVADNMDEIDLIAATAKFHSKIVQVSLRVKPGVEAHTHEYIQTAKEDSKFGLGIADGTALTAIKKILTNENLKFKGLHCHIGSQIFELEPFQKTIGILVDFMSQVKTETGHLIGELNVGGGFGIKYVESDTALAPHKYLEATIQELRTRCDEANLVMPSIAIEPGRSIVGASGITLYTVGGVKDIPGVRKYVSVDGGMADNIRPALYQAEYMATIANKADGPKDDTVTIAGRCCESGDLLIKNAKLQQAQVGDTLAVFATGAYNYSMASNYNKLPIPEVVLVNDGKSEVMVRRQTFEELTGRDEIPTWLR